jgi:hypothetical protein
MSAHALVLAAASLAASLSWNASAAETAARAQPHPSLASLPGNTVKDLGPYTCTEVQGEPPGRCRLVTDYSAMVYDRNRHRMVVFGGGHTSTNYDSLNTFDLASLKWVEEYPPTPCTAITAPNFDAAKGLWRSGPGPGPYPRAAARHTTDQLVILGDELIVLAYVEGNGPCSSLPKYTSYDFTAQSKVSHYDFRARSWSFHAAEGGQQWPGTAYDPVSNKIALLGVVGLEIYDPVSKSKTRPIDLTRVYGVKNEKGGTLQNLLRYNNNLVYYPPNRKMYYFEAAARQVYELDLNRADFTKSTITRLETTGTPPPSAPMGYAYDPVSRTIGGGPVQNTFYTFDPGSKAWKGQTVQGGTPGSVAFHAIDYDPVNNVFVFITDQAGGRRTWAYRHIQSSGSGRPE